MRFEEHGSTFASELPVILRPVNLFLPRASFAVQKCCPLQRTLPTRSCLMTMLMTLIQNGTNHLVAGVVGYEPTKYQWTVSSSGGNYGHSLLLKFEWVIY
jgi:hypothetical protein